MSARTLSPDDRLLVGLAALTAATGLIDATSYLGLGHVFTANMTGNIVFLGFAFGGAAGFSIVASLLALGGFLAGAVVAGALSSGDTLHRVTTAFVLEAVALGGGAIIAAAVHRPGTGAARWILLSLLGGAMGVQNATVRRLAVPDMTTTVLTLTLTGIASDSRLAGGTNPRLQRRVTSVLLMLAGAAVGAVLERQALWWPIAVGALTVTGSLVMIGRQPDRRR